jgi:hypothetical protein
LFEGAARICEPIEQIGIPFHLLTGFGIEITLKAFLSYKDFPPGTWQRSHKLSGARGGCHCRSALSFDLIDWSEDQGRLPLGARLEMPADCRAFILALPVLAELLKAAEDGGPVKFLSGCHAGNSAPDRLGLGSLHRQVVPTCRWQSGPSDQPPKVEPPVVPPAARLLLKQEGLPNVAMTRPRPRCCMLGHGLET